MNLLNNEQKMLDILFAKRNKSYGAYAIRSAYGSTVFRSLFIVAFTVATSAGLAYWLKDSPIMPIPLVNDQDTSVKTIVCVIQPPVTPPEVPNTDRSSGGTRNTENSTNIRDNALDTAKQVVNTDITPPNTSTSTAGTGSETNTNVASANTNTTSGGGGSSEGPSIFPDENPEFEGGYGALIAFIKKNLVYPGEAADYGKQGTVYVKFVVDEAGKVTNIILQNNLGYGLDDEAMRVVRLIPKFKSPGKIKGQPVKTYYQIPIKFKLG